MKSSLMLGTLVLMVLLPAVCHAACSFPAIFNFGDSTSDTGGLHFSFPYNMLAENPPYGKTFFGKPVNRYSDGRLSIDFFANALGYPFLSPYLQSVGSSYTNGVNFAAAGASVRGTNFIAPLSLTVQINQFKIFKQQVLSTIHQRGPQSFLPSEKAFWSGIYMIEIGGNDFTYSYQTLKLSTDQVQKTVLPKVARSIAGAVMELYNEGARTILVKDVGPQGCGPFWLTYFSPNDLDQHGCSTSFNQAVQSYNRMLRAELAKVRKQLPQANVVYVNTYDILYDFIANPSYYGFKATTSACCGVGGKYNYDYAVQCGISGMIHGKSVKAESCSDPASYANWDGVHWTDQANRLLTQKILEGKYFEPSSFSISRTCQLQSI
ncbi:hypothetical protein SUGI_0594390 [Cryptomeria japonica]|nr:hypothetical protein SUGI_0594390 [Cryptomeria japonica]